MAQGIVVGLDGTPQAEAAAAWAADEAVLRGTGVHLVHVKEPWPEGWPPPVGGAPDGARAEGLLTRTAAALRERHAGLSVTTRLLDAGPVTGLVAAGEEGDLLVLGSRALGSVSGYLLGSVGLSVVGALDRPVVLVRAPGATAPRGPVAVGVDLREEADAVLGFAFEEAERRQASLHVVHVQQLPLLTGLGPAMVPDVRPAVQAEIERSLDALLEPWRTKYPAVTTASRVLIGSAGPELVRASADAALVIVGRRTRRSPLGSRIGSVAHAVLHHGRPPVAVVPHD
ncbi:universal stress protein [Streptomyces sp. NPDC015232]|uniref:universal stress protein n=1 Tax=unclassified Streptomyces TaxID=2593676 RepID=UPI0036FBB9C4